MSVRITVTHEDRNGRGVLVAKGAGKQRTTNYDHGKSLDANRFGAAGVLANVILTPEQQAKVRHPSGGQRVRIESLTDGGGKHRITLNV